MTLARPILTRMVTLLRTDGMGRALGTEEREAVTDGVHMWIRYGTAGTIRVVWSTCALEGSPNVHVRAEDMAPFLALRRNVKADFRKADSHRRYR